MKRRVPTWALPTRLPTIMGNIGLSPGWDTQYYRNYRAAYFQDDWKVNSKLTVNLGVRYDFIQPASNKAGDLANFVISSENAKPHWAREHLGQSATGVAKYVLPAQVANSILFRQALSRCWRRPH